MIKSNEAEPKDALDVLRIWIKKYATHYGELKLRFTIQDSVVTDVYITDKTTHLRKDTKLNLDLVEKDTIVENEKKSHFLDET